MKLREASIQDPTSERLPRLLRDVRRSKPGPLGQDFGRYRHSPGLLITGLESTPAFGKLERYDQKRALGAAAMLNSCARYGYIDLSETRRIIDFGSGNGVPTLALVRLAEQNGGTVTALERDPTDAVARGLLTSDQLHVGDGLRFLDDMASRGERCDLVTAFMLGPDDGALAQELIVSSSRALDPQGHLLIRSDCMTNRAVEHVFHEAGIAYQNNCDTLITSFAEC